MRPFSQRDSFGKNDNGFSDRRNASQDAKKAALEKFRAQTAAANDPEAVKRREERAQLAAEREARQAAAKAAKEAQAAAEKLAREEAAKAEAAAAEAARLEANERATQEAAEQKAARDARYAARKARKN